MGRVLVLLLIVVGLTWWWLARAARVRRDATRRDNKPGGPASTMPQAMVRCVHCGLHLPRADALADGERLFCSEDHRRLGTGG